MNGVGEGCYNAGMFSKVTKGQGTPGTKSTYTANKARACLVSFHVKSIACFQMCTDVLHNMYIPYSDYVFEQCRTLHIYCHYTARKHALVLS